jgi:hypothetical protein
MAIPFWPKIAGVEDAPNYRPTAGDSRCETCSYFRALNSGVGYCERFSFEAEPQSVCDEFVGAGRTKVSSAPRSIMQRLKDVARNPVTGRVLLPAAVGASAGASVGMTGTGRDAPAEGLRGALMGGVAGAALGGIGPALRARAARLKFDQDIADALTKNTKAKEVGDTAFGVAEKAFNVSMKSKRGVAAKINEANELAQELRDLNARGLVGTPRGQQVLNQFANLQASLSAQGITSADKGRDFLADLARSEGTFEQVRKGHRLATKKLTEQAESLKKRKEKGVELNMRELATAGNAEGIGLPALSGLIGAGLGFGTSQGAREQEFYRKSNRQGDSNA